MSSVNLLLNYFEIYLDIVKKLKIQAKVFKIAIFMDGSELRSIPQQSRMIKGDPISDYGLFLNNLTSIILVGRFVRIWEGGTYVNVNFFNLRAKYHPHPREKLTLYFHSFFKVIPF